MISVSLSLSLLISITWLISSALACSMDRMNLKSFKCLDISSQRDQLRPLFTNWEGDREDLLSTILEMNILDLESVRSVDYMLERFMEHLEDFEGLIVDEEDDKEEVVEMINALIEVNNFEAAEYILRKYSRNQCHPSTLLAACREPEYFKCYFSETCFSDYFPSEEDEERFDEAPSKRFEFVKMLLTEFNAELHLNNQENPFKLFPLCLVSSKKLASLLIDHGAHVDLKFLPGRSLLHNAAANQNRELFEFYLELGLNPLALDDFGQSPRDILNEQS